MGLIAEVFRSGRFNDAGVFLPDDCTLHGWSEKNNRVLIVNADGPFETSSCPDIPHVKILKHRSMNCLHAVSCEHMYAGKWTMFGGNFLYSSDTRFGNLCRELLGKAIRDPAYFAYGAVPIHDRVENN